LYPAYINGVVNPFWFEVAADMTREWNYRRVMAEARRGSKTRRVLVKVHKRALADARTLLTPARLRKNTVRALKAQLLDELYTLCCTDESQPDSVVWRRIPKSPNRSIQEFARRVFEKYRTALVPVRD